MCGSSTSLLLHLCAHCIVLLHPAGSSLMAWASPAVHPRLVLWFLAHSGASLHMHHSSLADAAVTYLQHAQLLHLRPCISYAWAQLSVACLLWPARHDSLDSTVVLLA